MSRIDELSSWHSDWKNLRVAIIGLGVTGFSVADTLAELGASSMVFAPKAAAEYLDILDVLGVPVVTGESAEGLPQELVQFDPELLITSPGVLPTNEAILWAKSRNIPIWIDVDLAWRLRDKTERAAEWICITGTNGKTTTTQLVTEMLRADGLRAVSCGNIGVPILDCVRDPEGWDFLVVELSSFQLHYLNAISPVSSAILNIDNDHLDWHGSFEAYAQAKGKVYSNTQQACIYNVADKKTESLLEAAEVVEGARAIGFTLGTPAISQVGYVEDILCDRAFLDERQNSAIELATDEEIESIGVVTPHLKANIAAAAALARSIGVSPEAIRNALSEFKLDAHRIELVGVFDGITYIDDSKATNPHAAAASLSSFDHVVWLVGGLLKGVDITPLVQSNRSRLRGAVVIGVEREPVMTALAQEAPDVPVIEIEVSETDQVMVHAVRAARNLAMPGDTVLLAPASASMDQFRDYADRGAQFSAAVRDAQRGVK